MPEVAWQLNGLGPGGTSMQFEAAPVPAADLWGYLASQATVTGSLGKLLVDNLNATVSSRSTYAGGAVASVTAPVTAGTVTDKSGYALTQAFPTNFSLLLIDADGKVTALGGGGSADWTAAEKQQIRAALGVSGASAPTLTGQMETAAMDHLKAILHTLRR